LSSDDVAEVLEVNGVVDGGQRGEVITRAWSKPSIASRGGGEGRLEEF
jgi:hypothetical protein